MRCTVDGLTPNRSAMTRMPGRPGVARASRIRFSSAGAIGGRPRRFPSLLALASPARTRSWIMARSNSANTPIIWNIALPAGVVVSSPCWRRNRSILNACSSDRKPTKSCRLRPNRSTDHDAQPPITRNFRWCPFIGDAAKVRDVAKHVRRPARPVARPQPLRDNPLQAHLAGKETILVERMLSRASLPAGPN